MNPITESNIETFAIEVLKTLGWQCVQGLAISPGAELGKAVARLDPVIPDAILRINETHTLTILLDILLPKLMRGEVRGVI